MLVGDLRQQFGEVAAGEGPLEGCSGALIVTLEGEQALFKLG
jgi:hypothetical protein